MRLGMVAENVYILISLLMFIKVYSTQNSSDVNDSPIVISSERPSTTEQALTTEISSTLQIKNSSTTIESSSVISTTIESSSVIYTTVESSPVIYTSTATPFVVRGFFVKVKGSTIVELRWNNNTDLPLFSILYNSTQNDTVDEGKNCDTINSSTTIITGLRPWTNYSFYTRLMDYNDWVYQTNCITLDGIPHQPTNLTSKDKFSRNITIIWEAPKIRNGKINYTVNLTGAQLLQKNVTTEIYSIVPLCPDLEYIVTVRAYTTAGYGNVSESYYFTTDSEVPKQPKNVSFANVTSNSLRLLWAKYEECSPNILSFNVTRNTSPQSINGSISSITNNWIDIDELSPYTNYTFSVQAWSRSGGSYCNPCQEYSVQTNETVPDAPMNVLTRFTTKNWIIVAWSPPDVNKGRILGYYVIYNEKNNILDNSFIISETNLYGNMTDLKAFTEYEVYIIAYTCKGNGTKSEIKVVKTDEDVPNKPQKIKMVDRTSTSITLSWEKPEPLTGLTNYSIAVCMIEDEETSCPSFTDSLCPDKQRLVQRICGLNYEQTNETVRSLEKFHSYIFFVLAFTSKGSNHSEKHQEKTCPDVPGQVMELEVIDVSPLKREVLWKPPIKPNGEIESYNLNITGNKIDNTNQECTNSVVRVEAEKYLLLLIIECIYTVEVAAKTRDVEQLGEKRVQTFIVNATAPYEDTNPSRLNGSTFEILDRTTQIPILIPKFEEKYGKIVEYVVIVATKDNEEEARQCFFTNDSCSPKPNWHQALENNLAYQVNGIDDPNVKWLPNFFNGFSVPFRIGDKDCSDSTINKDIFCNNKLKPGVMYSIKVRAYTKGGYAEIGNIHIRTDPVPTSDNLAIIGAVIGTCLVALIVILLFVYIRKQNKGKCFPMISSSNTHLVIRNGVIPRNKKIRKSRPVKTKDFLNHLDDMKADSGLKFSHEYEELKIVSPKCSSTAAELEANRSKNRYINISPFDHSRVKLLPTDDDESSDYINASYMPGFNSPREFIAAQGPLPGTKDDFWRLIWEQNVSIIVMVTQCVEKGRKKCEQYWPLENEPQFFGDLQVNLQSESVLSNYTLRVLEVQLEEKKHLIKQLNFLLWPDFGCPDTPSSLVSFAKAMRSHISPSMEGPILVHCSAGVGRTGTFIIVDRLLQIILAQDSVDIFGMVLEMRQYRCNMVQTEDQYIYIHECLAEAIKSMDLSIVENGKFDTCV